MTASIEAMALEVGGRKYGRADTTAFAFDAAQLTRFAALVRARTVEDAARECEAIAEGKLNQTPHRYCAAAIRALPPLE